MRNLRARCFLALLGAVLLTLPALAQPAQSFEPPQPTQASQSPQASQPTQPLDLGVEAKGAVLAGAQLHLTVSASRPAEVEVLVDGTPKGTFSLAAGANDLQVEDARPSAGEHEIVVRSVASAGGSTEALTTVSTLPGWISILPPLVAIALALIFKEVLVALFAGVFLGALALFGWDPFAAFGRLVDLFVSNALADGDHAKILIFSTLLGGMAAVMSRSGGTRGIVELLRPLATNPQRGQLATWAMGVMIFFDDYANTLIVGNTMRPVTDRLKISREKLAYIVDSTAAPVASVFPISTWIGFEVGLIAGAFATLDLSFDAYGIFLESIPYRFYPILALVLGFTIAASRRDFGPMLHAERRAARHGKVIGDGDTPLASYSGDVLEPPDGKPHLARNALVPILTVIGVTLLGLYRTGAAALDPADYADKSTFRWVSDVFSNSSSYDVLLWASLSGALVALLLPLFGKVLSLKQGLDALVEGFKSMLLAVVVLLLAWSIGDVCDQLHTADFLVDLTRGVLSPVALPILVFLISAAVAFATGTSWATMSILIPLVIPMLHALALDAGYVVGEAGYMNLLLGTVSSVLAGSVWGDHCSPISDTTILSSMGSGCDHIAHVRTQLPYALSVGVLGMLIGDLPAAFGLSPWISLLIGIVVIVAVVRILGKPSSGESEPEAA